jgi:hypothetical protein
VKVSPLSGAMRFLDSVRGKRDSQGQHHGSGKNGSQENPEREEPTPDELKQAIEEFRADAQAAKNGLSALMTGEGPGLKITLQDERGSVIRQLTGTEFLRLREAAKQSEQPRGKILDQKL